MSKVERINPISRIPEQLPKETGKEKVVGEKPKETPPNVDTGDIVEISDEAREALKKKKKESDTP